MQKILISLGVGVILLGGAWYIFAERDSAMEGDAMQKNESAMAGENEMEGDTMKKEDGAMMSDTEAQGDSMMKKGSYESYAMSKLARAEEGDVVLFFRASWCPTCSALDANIRANAPAIPEGLTILDVDYDNSSELKQKYGVTYQHTFVQVDSTGKLIKKWSGSPTLSALAAKVQ